MGSLGKPKSSSRVMFYAGCEDVYNNYQPSHFLDSCFLCHKPFGSNNDIFMYRGNTPFCSDECRQEQIEIDETKERPWSSNCSSRRVLRKADTPTKTGSKKPVQSGTTVVVA